MNKIYKISNVGIFQDLAVLLFKLLCIVQDCFKHKLSGSRINIKILIKVWKYIKKNY